MGMLASWLSQAIHSWSRMFPSQVKRVVARPALAEHQTAAVALRFRPLSVHGWRTLKYFSTFWPLL
jgi:hypothetical protein